MERILSIVSFLKDSFKVGTSLNDLINLRERHILLSQLTKGLITSDTAPCFMVSEVK